MMKPMIHNARGFTLIEVLVAMVVLGVGLLGIAGLQATSLKNNYNAYLRTQVIEQGHSLTDRVRANVAAAVAGSYVASAAPTISYDCETDFTGTSETNKCSTSEMAAADLTSWYGALADHLPSAVGTIVCADVDTSDTDPCTRGSMHTITVSWSEQEMSRDASNNLVGAVTKSFAMSFQP